MKLLTILSIAGLLLLGSGCSNKQNAADNQATVTAIPPGTAAPTVTDSPTATTVPTATAESTEQYIRDKGRVVLMALKNQDTKLLAAYMDPEVGIRFSPYSFIDTKQDLVFKGNAVEGLMTDSTVYNWGTADGSGEPIKLKFADYYKKFIYDHDFTTAKEVGYNKILGTGNMKNNVKDVYSGDSFIEYHFSGFDAKVDGQDWKSLRLIFHQKGTEWYLVGIDHDQWTI